MLHAQEVPYSFIAEYELQYKIDPSKPEAIFYSEPFILYTGKEKSFYISANQIARDTLLYSGKAGFSDLGVLMSKAAPSTYQRFIKNVHEQSLIAYEEISSTLYSYPENIPWNWQLESDTMSMANHILKKATTHFKGRDYIAWYSEDIPISDGPYKFSGLPGLIFKIYDSQQQFTFELLNYSSLAKEKQINLAYDKESKTLTEKKFKATKLKFFTDPFPLLESEGIFFPEESKRRVRDKHRQKYENSYDNRIELTN